MPLFYNDAVDDQLAYERVESFGGGMDAYTHSTLLPPDASQYLENVLILDNLEARTRPGADLLGAAGQPAASKIQGLLWFDNGTNTHLVAGSNGNLYKWDGAAWTQMNGWNLVDAVTSFAAAMGVDKALFSDGQTMRIWNGAAWSAAPTNTPTSLPVGATALLWHVGRMWAAGFPGTGGAGKERDAVCGSALLNFDDGQWNLTDWSFRVGAGDGDPVVGLVSMPASVPEQAVLGVLKRNSIHIIRTDPTVQFTNFQDQLAPEPVANGVGVVGPRAAAVLANDLIYVASDRSIRSLARMEAAATQYQVSPPLSLPVQPYLDQVNWAVANTIAVVRYRQLALVAVPLGAALTPNTVLVWNGRLQRWVGIWTGWTPQAFEITRFNGQQHLVIGDSVGNVNQWKDTSDDTASTTYLDNGNPITTRTWTRSFLFQEPLNPKDPFHSEARFSTANALVNFTLNADGSDLFTWQADMRQQGPNLPQQLPFNLQQATNIPARKGLRGQPPFSEAFVKIESTQGWYALRNFSLSAFINTLANQ